jgi:hypothetical protein
VTIIAGFRCQGGVLLCSDTQETSGDAKRNVTKLQCFQGPVVGQDGNGMVNADLALAICGAGYGPFIDTPSGTSRTFGKHQNELNQ